MGQINEYFNANRELSRIVEDLEAGGPQKRAFIKTFLFFSIFVIVAILSNLISDISNGMSFWGAVLDTFIYPLFN